MKKNGYFAMRLSDEQKEKLELLGGADWVREMIDASVTDGKLTRTEKAMRGFRLMAEAMTQQRDVWMDECLRLRASSSNSRFQARPGAHQLGEQVSQVSPGTES